LFGTDGIRGVAGAFPLDASTMERIGLALAWTLREQEGAEAPRILVGRDTRESGPALEQALVRGIRGGGGAAAIAGVLTTPAVAHLTRAASFDAGVILSASHNPYDDNGIKIFSRRGHKLPDAEELAIERRILGEDFRPEPRDGPAPSPAEDLLERYLLHLAGAIGPGRPLSGVRVALDCAHGGACRIGPEIFARLGATTVTLGTGPDGRNINAGCGALHPEPLAALVRKESTDIGFAFDGDGDRVVVVDRAGQVLDGDHILFLAAQDLKDQRLLSGDAVVATVMSNLWLEKALAGIGVRMLRAPVGDRYVLEEMLKGGFVLGGEQSGHIIFLRDATTGDGLLTALKLLDLLRRRRIDLASWAGTVLRCPQILVNVRVASKPPLDTLPDLKEAVGRAERSLQGRGRVLLRYSGTEPILRVMVEGENETEIRSLAEELRERIASRLGPGGADPDPSTAGGAGR
jgi:phosphoglucosamine mutase